jgi:hypothetical protein
VHLWVTGTGVPRFGICNRNDGVRLYRPGFVRPPDGFEAPDNSFFYPVIPFP